MINEKNYSREESRSPFEDMPYAEMMSRTAWCNWENGRVMDRLDAVGWASVFIWGALVLLAYVTGWASSFSWWDGWGMFFTGVAVILLVGTGIRWLVPEYRRAGLIWGLVFGLILLGIGLGEIAVWIWPLLLGAIGITILYRVFMGGR
jgi:hypothetical protein